MFAATSGDGPPVLFLHGGGVSGWLWGPVLAQLSGEVRALVPDLPGHGQSATHPYRSHRETLGELLTLIRRAAPGGVVVVGFSLGAQLAVLLASAAPELVRSAVLISGEAIPAPLPRTTLAALRASAPLARVEWFARAQARQLGVPTEFLPDYVRDSRAITPDTLISAVGANIRFTPPPAWSEYGGEVTVLVGSRERRLMLDSARLLAGDRFERRVTVVPGAGHDLPFSRVEVVANAVRTALAHTEFPD